MDFVGSNLVPKLIEAGHEVTALERVVTGRYGKLEEDGVEIKSVDLTDHERIGPILKDVNPDIIIHLAALSSVGYSYFAPQEMFRVNALASINLAEQVRLNLPNLQHYIHVSTTEVLGVTHDRPAKETTTCIPNSPYSISKHSAEKFVEYLWMAHQFPMTIIRPTNCYGRVRDVNFLIERCTTQMLTGQTVKLGDPNPIRDWLYIDDKIDAYMAILNNRDKSIGEVFNISTHENHTIVDTAHIIKRLTGFVGSILWGHGTKRPLDIQDHRINSDKIRNMLGWAPRYSLEEGLKLTIEKLRAKLQTTAT